MATVTGAQVIGRDDELATIDAFLSSVVAGPAALVLRGEPGIGKTTLWQAAVDAACDRSFCALIARPAESEARLSFASLSDLLDPVLDDVLLRLPAPQRRALGVALLLEDAGDPAPDERVIGVASLNVIRVLAEASPVLVAVDDVQWLDAPSASVLRFVARRLRDEPVGMLLSERVADVASLPLALDRALPNERVTSVPVGALSLGALHRLVHERLNGFLARPIFVRLHEASGGNPFFALEIARAVERGGIVLVPGDPLPVPQSLNELVRERLACLPVETRESLLVVAALSDPRLELVEAALGTDASSLLRPAIDAQVLVLEGDRSRFTHPLLRSAAYSAADPLVRRQVHRRLAAVVSDEEEHARHLALAASGPDSSVAEALDGAALHARDRGAVAAAAELSERALALTPSGNDEAIHRRTLVAARLRFESGDALVPRQLLEELVASSPPGSGRAEAMADLARVYMFEGARRRAVALLRDALDEADDISVRAIVSQRLTGTLTLLREDLLEARELTRASAEWADRIGDRRVLTRALAAVGFVGGVVGDPDARAILERAVQLERHAGHLDMLERPTYNLAAVLMWSDDLDRARSIFTSLYREAAEAEDEGSLAWTAGNLANVELLAGNWDAALRWANEGDEIASQTGQPAQQAYAKATKALVHAHRGDVSTARTTAAQVLELSGDEIAIGWMNARWALGLLELSLGDAGAAHEVLDPACAHVEKEQIGEPGTARFVFDEVEALIVLGRADEAERRLAHIEAHAQRLDRAFALAAVLRCRGLLALLDGDLSSALHAFECALAQHARVPATFDRARTLLAQGVALRRAKRRREARATLEDAIADFERLGARLFRQRAGEELARIGGRKTVGNELTATEQRLAELVAEGRSNKEIAAALFVTPKTVGTKLSRIYAKLGVHSRTELVHRLAERSATKV